MYVLTRYFSFHHLQKMFTPLSHMSISTQIDMWHKIKKRSQNNLKVDLFIKVYISYE